MPYKGGETVNLHPVEWVTENKGFLTHITTTYRADDGRKFQFSGQVPRMDQDERHERLAQRELAEQLSHASITFPE
jgi:hypothetical protein